MQVAESGSHGIGDSRRKQMLVNATVLLGGKNVGADGEIIVVAIHKLEWEHGVTAVSMILAWKHLITKLLVMRTFRG